MRIRYAIISKKGPRSNNEDYVRVADKPEESQWLGVVCDGMGGHAMGDVAAETVCNAICEYCLCADDGDTIIKLNKACRSASAKLDKRSSEMNHLKMGTTLAMASIDNNVITIAHCGDSRCYLMRRGNLLYETKDHAGDSFNWNVVTKCFFSYDPEASVPDIAQFEIKPGDRVLLCSDGLYKSMPPEILKARMMDDKTPEEILDVYDFLCEKNADDNYTAILAIVE